MSHVYVEVKVETLLQTSHGINIATRLVKYIGKEEQRLAFSNIDQTASGTYKCVAKSHSLTDEKSIEIIVYCK